MQITRHLKKVNQRGIIHHIVPIVAFLVLFGVAGTYFYVSSHAAAKSGLIYSALKNSSGKEMCLDDYQSKNVAGTPVNIFPCNQADSGQQWVQVGNTIHIHSASGLCLDAKSNGTKNGTPIDVWTCNGGKNQQWTFNAIKNVSGQSFIVGTQSSLCLDVKGAGTANNTPTDLYACKSTGNTNQQWSWDGTGSTSTSPPNGSNPTTPSSPTSGTTAALQLPLVNSAGYHMCLDDNGNKNVDNNKVDVWQCNGSQAQTWSANSNGTITIHGKCLEATKNAKANGTLIGIYTCNNTGGQKWIWKKGGVGTTFVNPNSGRCLDDKQSSTANGTQLELYTCNSGLNQLWLPVTPASSSKKVSTAASSAPAAATAAASPAVAQNTSADVVSLLNVIKESGGSINCTTLQDSTDVNYCNGVFGQ